MECIQDDYIFVSGFLRNSVFVDAEIQANLSTEESEQITASIQALKELLPLLCERNNYTELPQELRSIMIVRQVELQKKALEYVKFLAGKAGKLLKHSQFKVAEAIYTMAFNFACELLTSGHTEALKIELDLRIVQFQQNAEASLPKLEEVLLKLNANLAKNPTNDTKQAIAIGEFIVAQYHSQTQNFEQAERYLNHSEILRREYGASETEFDKIKFLRARIILENNPNDRALSHSLLRACYAFRNSSNSLNPSLIPVLECLLMTSQNRGEKAVLLDQLLKIQKSLEFDDFQILHTQLEMLKVMWSFTSQDEWYGVMEDLETRFKAIPVERESSEIGLSYLDFAEARLSNFTPMEWSYVRKQQYFEETFRLICKAKNHLQRTGALSDPRAKKIEYLANECLVFIQAFEDPSQFRTRGQPLQPEDEAKILAIKQQIDRQDGMVIQELKALSEFSSEVDYTLIDPNDSILTAADFQTMSGEGAINPCRLRIAQGGINSKFRNGQSLEDMKQRLINDPQYTDEIPPVEICVLDGRVFSLDSRRLIAHQQAREVNQNVMIRYKKYSEATLKSRIDRIYSERAWNGLVTALRFGGKNSAAEPYINPLFREQLAPNVEEQFKKFPNERKHADTNGFPRLSKQAKKIYDFLVKKAQEGSEYSTETLNTTRQIYNNEGEELAYQFLIAQKTRDLTEEKNQRDTVSIQHLALRAQNRIDRIQSAEQQNAVRQANP